MNKLLYLFSLILFITSCKNNQDEKPLPKIVVETKSEIVECEDCKTALNFINSYLNQIDPNKNSKITTEEWVKQNLLASESFKKEYIETVNKAVEEDPELGLEYDYILDAQDYPDEGFDSKRCECKNGVVKLTTKNWKGYFLIIKLINENGKMKVDACGTINIPESERFIKE